VRKHTDFEGQTRRSNRTRKALRVTGIHYEPTPDADERLSRAINILLGSAARVTAKSEDNIDAKKEGTPHQAPAEDTLTRVDEERNSHE